MDFIGKRSLKLAGIRCEERGRAAKPLAPRDFELLVRALWLDFFQISGNKSLSMFYYDDQGRMVALSDFADLMAVYSTNRASSLVINNWHNSSAGITIELRYIPRQAFAILEVSATTHKDIDIILGMFREAFPLPPIGLLEQHLSQRGFNFEMQNYSGAVPDYEQYLSLNARISKKELMGRKFEPFFEKFILEIVRTDFKMEVGLNCKLRNESTGGDYDVLALNDAKEVLYFECKSGSNVGIADFAEFFVRHEYLRPALSLMVFHESTRLVRPKLESLRQALTDRYRRTDSLGGYRYPEPLAIPDKSKAYAFTTARNIFVCGGDNIKRSLQHCLRYYDGVVKQSSYW